MVSAGTLVLYAVVLYCTMGSSVLGYDYEESSDDDDEYKSETAKMGEIMIGVFFGIGGTVTIIIVFCCCKDRIKRNAGSCRKPSCHSCRRLLSKVTCTCPEAQEDPAPRSAMPTIVAAVGHVNQAMIDMGSGPPQQRVTTDPRRGARRTVTSPPQPVTSSNPAFESDEASLSPLYVDRGPLYVDMGPPPTDPHTTLRNENLTLRSIIRIQRQVDDLYTSLELFPAADESDPEGRPESAFVRSMLDSIVESANSSLSSSETHASVLFADDDSTSATVDDLPPTYGDIFTISDGLPSYGEATKET